MNLPSAFEEKMKQLLGAEYTDYLDCFDEPRHYGLRVNTAKISVEDFLEISPWPLKKFRGYTMDFTMTARTASRQSTLTTLPDFTTCRNRAP